MNHDSIASSETERLKTMLGVMVFSTANSGGMRLLLLSLVLVAVVLLVAGGTIALLTLFNHRRSKLASIASNKLESEKI